MAITANNPDVDKAFLEYDRKVTIHNIQVGCLVGMVLMPLGVILDLAVYPQYWKYFLVLRFLCSFLILIFWGIVASPFGNKHHRSLGVILAMFPAACIAWMIYWTDGPNSCYYAGLNLVVLVIGFIVHWNFIDSLIAGALILFMYLAACIANIKDFTIPDKGMFINNLYFVVLTILIVVIGSFFHNQLRFREFANRFELDKSRQLLEENNKKLREIDEIKSRFFANISHELRTPLTLLLAPLEAILHLNQTQFDSKVQDWLQTMQANGMRLLKLINDLLELVRLESGKIQWRQESISVEEFINGLCHAVLKVAEDKRIKISANVHADVGAILADRDKLEKIVLNLMFNSIKFTPAGGRVSINVYTVEKEIVFEIADTGMGIALDKLSSLFQRFWQADTSSQRKYQGAGIGLALVKELVEAHQGSVSANSEVGKGTTMIVRLPLMHPDNSSQSDEINAPEITSIIDSSPQGNYTNEWLANLYRRAELFPSMSPLQGSLRPVEVQIHDKRPRVLIADDEPDMLRFMRSQLAQHYQVLEAVDGSQAIEKARQFLPDIILLDMMMPERDGVQVCQELQSTISTQAIPKVLITARADEETKLAALKSGASDFLSKPFSTTELHVRVKNLIEGYRWQRELARQNQKLEATLEQLKETEGQLVQHEKMASLGRMSAGIIHEINNPLNYVSTGLQILRRKGSLLTPEEQKDFEDTYKDINEGIVRVKNIVCDLRSFTHPNAQEFIELSAAEVVEASMRLLSNEWKNTVQIDVDIGKDVLLFGNRNKLVQVWVNLLQNAIHAVKKKQHDQEKPTIVIRGRIEDNCQILTLRDNGIGISPENVDKIFEPFFTTKDVGEGMGLGLSICYRIIEEHNGRISVRSKPNQYCEFILEFPMLKHYNTKP